MNAHDREERTRDAIAKTAQTWRESAARNNVHVTQTEAVDRVRKARERGDNIRSSTP